MEEGDVGASGKTYTEEEVQALVDERNKALEAKREEILKELKTAKQKLSQFDGVDLDELKGAATRLKQLEQESKAKKAGVTSEELDRLRREVREELEKEYSQFKSQAEKLAGEVRELRLDGVVKGEMAKAGVRGERVDALFRLTGDRFDLTDDGKPMLRDRPGTEVDKYIAGDLAKEYPEFFAGTGSSGGGASKSSGSAGASVRQIKAGDKAAFAHNLERIAKGEVAVVQE